MTLCRGTRSEDFGVVSSALQKLLFGEIFEARQDSASVFVNTVVDYGRKMPTTMTAAR